ncbi:hypothetical protein [Kitasatospora camelliae]|uniref:HNH endonuclease n=1 Tax=Kitasatospora camelliae TaxID=3156397 RepID=A0AAU8K6T0_9ACTN
MSWTPPDEALCAVCEETVAIRRDGRTAKHPAPYDPDAPIVGTITPDGVTWHTGCHGSNQQPSVRLEMSFARWLRAHHKRRDARDNPVTMLAQWVFKPCTHTKAKTVSELTWSTPEELRLIYMARQGDCNWIGEYIDRAEAEFEAYSAARAG